MQHRNMATIHNEAVCMAHHGAPKLQTITSNENRTRPNPNPHTYWFFINRHHARSQNFS